MRGERASSPTRENFHFHELERELFALYKQKRMTQIYMFAYTTKVHLFVRQRRPIFGRLRPRTRSLLLTSLLLVFGHTALAGPQKEIYLDPDDSFSPYFSSAIQKKNVPVTVTTDPKQADYTAQFQVKDNDGSIVRGLLSSLGKGTYDSGSFSEVVLSVTDTKSKNVVFSYTCKKSSQYLGASSALGTSVAECLAKHWKEKLASSATEP